MSLFSFLKIYVHHKNDSFLQRAIEEGADFIETDILSSKDGVLISFHDVTLDETTDIYQHKEFANRKRTYEVQGVNTTGFFTGMKSFSFQLPFDIVFQILII
jgi:glycerophosphoryl diester phosphodiesterase